MAILHCGYWISNFIGDDIVGRKIAIVGAPAQGKTSIASGLVRRINEYGLRAYHLREYVEEYLKNNPPPSDITQQMHITAEQIKKEKEAVTQYDLVVCDSCSFIGYIYATHFSTDPRTLLIRQIIHGMALKFIDSYECIFYLPKHKPVEQNGIRYHGENESNQIDRQIYGFLVAENISFYQLVPSTIDDEISQILEIVKMKKLIDKQQLKPH